MLDLDTSIRIVGHVLVAVCVEDNPDWWHPLYDTPLIVPVFMRFQLSWLVPVYVRHFQPLWRSWSIIYLQPLWRSWSFVYLHHGDSNLCILYVAMTTYVFHAYSWPLYSYVSGTARCICRLYAELYHGIMLIGWLVFHLGTFITSLLGWTYNVFRPSYNPSNLIH